MPTREQRIRKRLFPGISTFNRQVGGFAALPLILRRSQHLFNARQWQVYTYTLMRTGPAGVAWFTLDEMSWDLNFRSVSKLKPYVDELVEAGWLHRRPSQGRDYYLVPDPIVVLEEQRTKGKLAVDRIEAIDELLEMLKRPALGVSEEAEEEAEQEDEVEAAPASPARRT